MRRASDVPPRGSEQKKQATFVPAPTDPRTGTGDSEVPRDPHDEVYATHDPVVTNGLAYQFSEVYRYDKRSLQETHGYVAVTRGGCGRVRSFTSGIGKSLLCFHIDFMVQL